MAIESGSNATRLAGREPANVDDKGRVLVSKRKREILGDDFVMRIGDNGCICMYSKAEWAVLTAEMDAYPRTSRGRQRYSHLLMETVVEELNFDGQGRVVIPRLLRDDAKIKDQVMIVGCDERAEIWAVAEYEEFKKDRAAYRKDLMDEFDQARRQMREGL